MKRPHPFLSLVVATGGAAALFYGVSFVGSSLYSMPDSGAAQAYVPVAPEPTAPNEDAGVGVVQAGAGGDTAAGEKVFKACKSCHTAAEGGKNATGPNLWAVVGRKQASVEGFKYSDAMMALGGMWDAATLDAFLADPKGTVPGTKMTFAGVKDATDRTNLIAWLTAQGGTGGAESAATEAAVTTEVAPVPEAPPGTLFPELTDDAEVVLDEVAYPEGVTYQNPPEPTADEIAEIGKRLDALKAEIPTLDYQRARHHPIHFQPEIQDASNEECLACHQEILGNSVRPESIAGVKAADSLAWYQTLDTYAQDQASFHWRHMESDFARQVMNLDCVFCHKGNDPREESPDMMPGRAAFNAMQSPEFTNRKMVNPSETCLMCHGQFPAANMGLEGTWPELRADMETPEAPNGCLSCHADSFRTNRHAVTYLKAANIEEAARAGTSDTCFGCHGGRSWYRISYPYPRHAWPLMDTESVPDWATGRPTESKPEYKLPTP